MNKSVNFEIAKLLKEKGFEQKERPSYLLVPFQECTTIDVFDHPSGSLGYGDMIGYYLPNKTINAPTVAEVVMWLYEKHGIWISIDIRGDYFKLKIINKKSPIGDGYLSDCNGKLLNSPTEAYEAAITYCLENLIQGGNK